MKVGRIICSVLMMLHLPLLAQVKLQPLRIGDKVPDYVFAHMINYKSPSENLSAFKGKPLVIDFWATWCGVCIQKLPKLDSLQKEFEGKVQFLMVSNEAVEKVRSFFKKRNAVNPSKVPVAADPNSKLFRLFDIRYIPHYVWIGSDGTIRAITDATPLNKENVLLLLQNINLPLPTKIDEKRSDLDLSNALLVDTSLIKRFPIRQFTIVTERIAGISSQSTIPIEGQYARRRLLAMNVKTETLFRIAFGDRSAYHLFPKQNTIMDLKDTSKVRPGSLLCYDMIVAPADSAALLTIIRKDLMERFEVSAKFETRQRKCLVLKNTSGDHSITKGQGQPRSNYDAYSIALNTQPISKLIEILKEQVSRRDIADIIDETSITGMIDLNISADITDVKSINSAFARYHLILEEAVRPVKMLIISN